MARVEWSRLSGDETEAVLGVLLCREHPTATRVKPSKGDGGIDVWVPEHESAIVYQIKGYTGKIDSTRKGHITKSWNTVVKYAADNLIKLSGWYLITPENPTKELLKWFKDLTKNAAYPCVWRGLDFVDGLAAKYPDVIDYYLRDGKDRLQETVQLFLSLAGHKDLAASPASSIDFLAELHASLNKFDPHFRYDFSVQAVDPDGNCPPAQVTPTTIASVQFADSNRCITYNIIPLFNEALKERPVPGSMTLVATPDSPLQQQLDDWVKYGTPIKDVPAQKVAWDLPGGFGGSWDEARVTVGASKPSPGTLNETITLRVLDASNTVLSALDFTTEEVSSGIGQKGLRNVGHDTHAKFVRYELRMLKDDNSSQVFAKINVSVEDSTGRIPGDMLPGLHFLSALRPPRRIQIFSRLGPALSPPLDIPQELMPESQGKLWILMCESLATIQEHIIERIKFPDMAKYHGTSPMDDIEQWYQAARLLRGEVLDGNWTSVEMHLHSGVDLPSEPTQIVLSSYYQVRVGPKYYQLGIVNGQAAQAQVDPTFQPVVHDGHMDIRLIPGDNDAVTIRLIPGASVVGIPNAPAPYGE